LGDGAGRWVRCEGFLGGSVGIGYLKEKLYARSRPDMTIFDETIELEPIVYRSEARPL
jgi:hypothetical protein